MDSRQLAKRLQALDTSPKGQIFWTEFDPMLETAEKPPAPKSVGRGFRIQIDLGNYIELYSSHGIMKILRCLNSNGKTEILADQTVAEALWTQVMESLYD